MIEFLRIQRVIELTGLSKAEIYRQIADGRFPPSRPYRSNPRKRFWTSTEIREWQQRQLGELFEDLLG